MNLIIFKILKLLQLAEKSLKHYILLGEYILTNILKYVTLIICSALGITIILYDGSRFRINFHLKLLLQNGGRVHLSNKRLIINDIELKF